MREKWTVGIVKAPIYSFLRPSFVPDVQWLNGGGRSEFLADGFGIIDKGKRFIIAERFTHRGWSVISTVGAGRRVRTGRGHITSITVDKEGLYLEEATALDTGMHMSYPYTFTDRDSWYCVAEEVSRDAVGLYRRGPNGVWRHVKDILSHGVVDPTIIHYGERWWLFGTVQERPNSALMIWHADSLGGPWAPHTGNPVRSDRLDVRPGGTPFVFEGQLFRPSQNCGHTYGGSIIINRVDCISTQSFREEPLREIMPLPTWQFNRGIHTISSFGDWTLVDGKMDVFLPSVVIRANLRRVLGAASTYVRHAKVAPNGDAPVTISPMCDARDAVHDRYDRCMAAMIGDPS